MFTYEIVFNFDTSMSCNIFFLSTNRQEGADSFNIHSNSWPKFREKTVELSMVAWSVMFQENKNVNIRLNLISRSDNFFHLCSMTQDLPPLRQSVWQNDRADPTWIYPSISPVYIHMGTHKDPQGLTRDKRWFNRSHAYVLVISDLWRVWPVMHC